MTEPLKPCPLCGSPDVSQFDQCDGRWVGCNECDCGAPFGEWQKSRAMPENVRKVVEEMEATNDFHYGGCDVNRWAALLKEGWE